MMPKAKLSREIGIVLLLLYGLGNILGAGIYVLVGKVAGLAGYFSLFSFLLACIVAAFTALSYTELASRYPVSAGAAVYIQEGLGFKAFSIAFGLLIAVGVLASAATIAHGFAGYLSQLISLDKELSVVLLIVVLVVISILSIKVSVIVASLLTLMEIFGLLIIIYYGFDMIIHPRISFTAFIPALNLSDMSVIILGAFLAFYAFLGFEDMVNIAEEVKEPSKTFPVAILLALGVSTVLYGLIVIIALQVLSIDELQASTAPFADIYRRLRGEEAILISVIGSFAVVNGALVQIIMASRIIYGMASKGWIPSVFAKVSSRTRTPVFSTLFVGAITLVFALVFDIVSLASYSSMLILLVFCLVNLSLIRIKSTVALPQGVRGIPLWIPWTGLILNLLFIGMKLTLD